MNYMNEGLHKLWKPVIPDERTGSEFGKYGEDGKHHKDDI